MAIDLEFEEKMQFIRNHKYYESNAILEIEMCKLLEEYCVTDADFAFVDDLYKNAIAFLQQTRAARKLKEMELIAKGFIFIADENPLTPMEGTGEDEDDIFGDLSVGYDWDDYLF